MRLPKLKLPLRTTLLYLLFGGLWILLSDQILSVFLFQDAQQAAYQTVKGWFFILVSGILLYLVLQRELAGRKQAEEALRRSEALLLQTGEMAKVGGWELDLQTMTPVWSLETYRIHEIDPSLHPDLENAINYYVPEARPIIREAVQRAIDEGQPYDLELSIVTAKGKPIWVRTMGQAEFRDGKCVRLFGTFQDITERKQAERQTLQMKRLYATLSQVNQTIVRVKEPDELYRSICDVAMKSGEFSLAWVGLLDESTGEVHPVAAQGLDVQQWPFQLVNIKTGPVVNGLIATSIRTSRVITSDDLQSDDTMQSAHELSQKYGYHASAGVPFQLRGKTIGILNLISPEIGFFKDQAEIHLLEEMGVDISYALGRLENEAERRQAEEKVARQNSRLKILREIDTAILAADSLEEIIDTALSHSRELIGCSRASLVLIDWEANEAIVFNMKTLIGTARQLGTRVPLRRFQEMFQPLSAGQQMLFNDLNMLTNPPPQFQSLIKEGLHSLCLLPLVSQSRLLGFISLSSEIPGFFNEELINLGGEVAAQVAIAITQHRLNTTLRENEERLRLSLQAANQGLYDLNVQTGAAIVNREYAQMLGYDPETFVETNAAWIERLHPDDRENAAKAYADYIGGLQPEYRIEFRQRMKDGNWKWILSLGKVIEYDAEGKPLRMLGTHTDITNRKQAEQSLQESEERFSKAFYESPTGILLVDLTDSTIRDVNDALLEMAALKREDLVGKSVTQLNLKIGPEVSAAITQELMEHGAFRNREVQLQLADGQMRYVLNSGALVTIGGRLHNLALIQDITERKQSEAVLRDSEERFRMLFESNPAVMMLIEPVSGAIKDANRAAAEFYGYSLSELRSMNIAEINQLSPDEIYIERMRALNEERNFFVFRHRLANGEIHPVEVHSAPMKVDGNALLFSIVYDITERKRVEEEIQLRSHQLVALLDTSQSLTESLNLPEVLQRITDKSVEVLKVETTAIYLVEGEQLYLGACTPPLPANFPDELRRAVLSEHPHIAESLATGQPVILPNTDSASLTASERTVTTALGLQTIVYVPLTANNNVIGVLILGAVGHPKEFSRNEEEVARTLSNQAALAIANAKLYENLSIYVKKLESQIAERERAEAQIQRQLKYLNALRMIDIAISSSFDLNIILDVVLQQVVSQLDVDATAIMLFNDQLQMTEYATSRGFRSDALRHTRLKLGEGYASQAVLNRKTIHISAFMETGNKLTRALQLANEEFVDYYGVPLIVKGEVKGVLEIYQRSYLKPDAEWLEFMEALAGQAAIAIDNAQLFENLQRLNIHLEQRVVERTAELNRTNTELEHANRIKDEFLANMSHELRTPLTSILGLSESLREQRRGSLNDHQDKSLEIIESSGRHLLELINDILDLSKIEAGKFDYYPQPISVDDICRSSLAFVKSQANKKSIAITYIQDTSISKIFADPRRLKQILVNLLSNAVKFTPEHGNVVLQVNADPEQDVIKFSVIDNGIGIAVHDLWRLFQPFVQVDSGLNRQHEGTGLGLALVQKLTDLHGGSVQVESELGKGSRFTVNLPCLQEEVRKLEKHQAHSMPTIRGREENTEVIPEAPEQAGVILLADDNMPSILTIGEYLESHGYEVVAAHDGSEALKQAEAIHPDLILMDIQMPVMNGLDAIARLREDIRFADTPIITLTALAMPGDRERSLLAGANEYMSKPVSLRRLAGTINELLRKQK